MVKQENSENLYLEELEGVHSGGLNCALEEPLTLKTASVSSSSAVKPVIIIDSDSSEVHYLNLWYYYNYNCSIVVQ